jgi:guanylate kinase
MYFEKLNHHWRQGIEAQIVDADGGEHLEIATAFREHYGKYLSEIVIARRPSKADLEEIGDSYTEYSAGWNAALEYQQEVIMWRKIIVKPETHARLMKIKKEEGRKSLDVVLNRLLDAAEEAKRQGINLVEGENDEADH